MKLIIVENDEVSRKEIKELILGVTFDRNDVSIETFNGATKELSDCIADQSEPKTYILDIDLDGKISGIDIAKKIRDNDWESHIIFITNHDKMFETVYRNVYEVFDFIEKFHDMETRLKKDIKKIISQKYDNKLFRYQNRKIDLQIYFKDITYIETTERKLIIHTTNNDYLINMNLSDILKKLDSRFKQVHRACIVNVERVVKYDWANSEFTLNNKVIVPLLSKRYKKEVVENV